jgi:hypothetical protein
MKIMIDCLNVYRKISINVVKSNRKKNKNEKQELRKFSKSKTYFSCLAHGFFSHMARLFVVLDEDKMKMLKRTATITKLLSSKVSCR